LPKHILAVLAGLSMTFLAACQPQMGRVDLGPDEKLQITRSVWQDYESYKSKLGRGGGAFVVTESGTSSGYSYCPGDHCRPGSFTQSAIELCEKAGVKCLVFAQGTTIKVDYEIVD
jgi:hypothetical protein